MSEGAGSSTPVKTTPTRNSRSLAQRAPGERRPPLSEPWREADYEGTAFWCSLPTWAAALAMERFAPDVRPRPSAKRKKQVNGRRLVQVGGPALSSGLEEARALAGSSLGHGEMRPSPQTLRAFRGSAAIGAY
jgi:hypothetical protein